MGSAVYLRDLFAKKVDDPMQEIKLPPERGFIKKRAARGKSARTVQESLEIAAMEWLTKEVSKLNSEAVTANQQLSLIFQKRAMMGNPTGVNSLEKTASATLMKAVAGRFPPLGPIIDDFLKIAEDALSNLKQENSRFRTWRSPISSIGSMATLRAQMEEAKKTEEELKTALEYTTRRAQEFSTRATSLEATLQEALSSLRKEKAARCRVESELEEMAFQNTRLEARIDYLEKENRRRFDLDLLEIALKQSREDLKELSTRLMKTETEYSDVVPRSVHDKLEMEFRRIQRENFKLSKKVATADKETEEIKNEVEILREENAKLNGEYQELRRSGTPRPQWAKCSEFISGGLPRWKKISRGKSSRDLLSMILAEFSGEHGIAKRPEFFQGKGTHAHVPKYLRWDGRVRNRHLGMRDVTFLIQDVWAQKKVNDDEMGRRQGMASFLAQYLEQRFPLPVPRIEWAYSFAEACKRFSHVEFIGLFWGILCGEYEEELYHDEVSIAKRLEEACVVHCGPPDDDDVVKDMIPIEAFREILISQFPLKSAQAINELVEEAIIDLRLPVTAKYMQFTKLFDEKEYGSKGSFLQLLSRQRAEDQERYVKEVLLALGKADSITLEMMRRAFVVVDPHIEQDTLNRYTDWIYSGQKKTDDGQLTIPIERLVRRLKRGNIHRVGPKPEY